MYRDQARGLAVGGCRKQKKQGRDTQALHSNTLLFRLRRAGVLGRGQENTVMESTAAFFRMVRKIG